MVNGNVQSIIAMLNESLNDRKVAVENFGNISFAKRGITGKDLKQLARKYKDAYQKWIEVLEKVDDEVCKAWDDYNSPLAIIERTYTPEQLKEVGLMRIKDQNCLKTKVWWDGDRRGQPLLFFISSIRYYSIDKYSIANCTLQFYV